MQRPSNESEANQESIVVREARREAASEPANEEEASRAKREAREAKASRERSKERREPRVARESLKESLKETPRESKESKESKAPKEFAGKEASETNRANSGSPCKREGPANSKNNSGRTAASGGSTDIRATRAQFTKEAPIVMSSGTASTASGSVPNNESLVTSGPTTGGISSSTGSVKQRQPSLQQLPQQQINELKKTLQNPKPSALSGGQSNSSLTSANETAAAGSTQATGSNVNTSTSSKIVQQNQETTPQTKRRTSDCQLKQQFGDLSISKPGERAKDQSKEAGKEKPPATKPNTTTSNTQQTNAPAQASATVSTTNTQSNSSKSANNKTTMPVLSADYFLNYQKEIERLKTRLEEERRKLNDVPCK